MHPHTFRRTQIRSVLRKWHQNQGSTELILTSQRTEIAKSACEPKCQGLLAETHWRSSTSSRKVRRLDNGWSQSPQRAGWITEQSPVRCRCSRSCHSTDLIPSVKNKDFKRDGKEFTKVPRPVTKAKSYSYGQFIEVWKILWRSIMEWWNFNTSSIQDKWRCGKSSTKSERRNFRLQSRLDEKW